MNKKITFITFIAVIGGFLFGLNMAGISGAVSSIQEAFSLTDGGIGFVVGIITIGSLLGALFTGKFADTYGRKKVFIIISLLFLLSSIGCALATNQYMLMVFRLIAGLAVGADSVVGPVYISEMAPAEKRGRLVSFQQFAIVTGILLAYLVDFFLLDLEESWRLMLAVPAIFSIIFLILTVAFLPESDRWHKPENKKDKTSKVKFGAMFKGRTGYVVMLGVFLAALQQLTGINAVINYAPIILSQTGVGGGTALLQSCLVGTVNFLATIIAIWLVDTKGRKTLLLWGAVGMILSLGYLTLSFILHWGNMGVLISLLVYIAFFAASFSPVMWVINSEIFPENVRAIAMSFSTAISWACTYLTVQFSPIVLNRFGGAILFGFFGLFSVIAFFFVRKFIPETKGKSLEQIQKELGV